MKKLRKCVLILLLVAMLFFLAIWVYCNYIRIQNVFDQMYYSRVHGDNVLTLVIDYRKLFRDVPQIATPARGADGGTIWVGNFVYEQYRDDYLEEGHGISFYFDMTYKTLDITYRIKTDGHHWISYLYHYDVDKKTLTYDTSDPENTEMKNFLFDLVLRDWFAANEKETRFSLENLGKYTMVDTAE